MVVLRAALIALFILQAAAQPVNNSVVYPDGPAPPISSKTSLQQELSAWEPLLVFTTLLNAHSYLLSSADLMILAPTNAAFFKLLTRLAPETENPLSAAASITQTLDKLINSPNLTRILAYHVIEKSAMESELGSSQVTASGGTVGFTNFPLIEDGDPVSAPRRTYRQIKTLGGSIMFLTDVLLPVPLQSMLPNVDNMGGNMGGMPDQTVPSGINTSRRQVVPPVEPPPEGSGSPNIFSMILASLTQTVFTDPFMSNAQLLGSRSDMQIMGTLVNTVPELNQAAMSAPLHILAPTDEAFMKLFMMLGRSFDLPEISLPNVNDPKFLSNLTEILKLTSAVGDVWNSVSGLPGLGEILQYHIIPNASDYETLLEMSRRAPVPTVLQNYSLVFQTDSVIDGDPSRRDPQRKATYPTLTGYVTVLDEVLTPFDTSVLGAVLEGAIRTPSPTPSTQPQESDKGACFPASARVYTRHGIRKIGDVLGGDEIRVNEHGGHSAVFMFTHKLITGEYTFVKLYTAVGHNITLTKGHYIRMKGRLIAAGNVRIGDMLQTISGESPVVKVESVIDVGLVAPHTVDEGLVVDGVLVSGYSQAVHPWIAHALLAPVRWYVRVSGAVEPFGGMFYGGGGGGVERFAPKGGAEYIWE